MEAAEAISLVTEFILRRGLDYPAEGLEAGRFEVGWSVFAPVEVDESDPMAFLEMPVGRSVFLVGDSGRIEEVSSSIPPRLAEERFTAQERASQDADGSADDSESNAEFERQVWSAAANGSPEIGRFTTVETAPAEGTLGLGGEEATAEEASRLVEPIVQQLAQLGPAGWQEFSAQFAYTVSSQIAQLRFTAADRTGLVPVPASIAELVRRQRDVAARMPAGPWWRLLVTVTNDGETSVDYDYGDEPFPADQLVAAEHYRNDLDTYPRPQVPVWLAGYVAGPAAQGRDPRRAAATAAADSTVGRAAVAVDDIPPVGELWARWAVLSAACVGVGSGRGPRIYPGYGWYEGEQRSGAALFVLPGERAVLSGGRWDSELLDAAYNGGEPLPDLYSGAPPWVNDSVLNTRNRNGLLSFCFWWANDQWFRGSTNTSGELEVALPAIRTLDDTVRAMIDQTGAGTADQCQVLLSAAAHGTATRDDVLAIFVNQPDADIDTAANQLSLAGLLVT